MTKAIEKKTAAPITQKRVENVKDLLRLPSLKKQLAELLPIHMTAERMMNVALAATSKTPELLECTPKSVFKCMLELSQLGLEPDGRHAHLIPRKNNRAGTVECTVVPDYKGLVLLAMNTGLIARIHSEIIRKNDDFVWSKGKVEKHDGILLQNRGEIIGAWCVIEFVNGGEKFELMSTEEINAVRDRQYKPTGGPWITDYPEMAKKTVYRRAQKWAPLKDTNKNVEAVTRYNKALDIDNAGFELDAAPDLQQLPETTKGKE